MPEPSDAPRSRLPRAVSSAPLLGRGTRFDGLVVIHGPARVDGEIRGQVLATGTVWIGETATVEGPVEAENLVVAGAVRGDIHASGRIALESSARVLGQVEAGRLVLAEGSFLEGTCHAGNGEES